MVLESFMFVHFPPGVALGRHTLRDVRAFFLKVVPLLAPVSEWVLPGAEATL